jgi:hypothetical protein
MMVMTIGERKDFIFLCKNYNLTQVLELYEDLTLL